MPDGEGGTLLVLRIIPGAHKTEIDGIYGELLKVRVKAPPLDGKANKELLKFLAKTMGLRLRDLQIIRGEKSRQKTVQIIGVAPDIIAEQTQAS